MKRVQPTLTGDRPAVTWPAVKAGRQLVLFDARQEGERDAADLAAGLERMRAAGYDVEPCPIPGCTGPVCPSNPDTTTDGG